METESTIDPRRRSSIGGVMQVCLPTSLLCWHHHPAHVFIRSFEHIIFPRSLVAQGEAPGLPELELLQDRSIDVVGRPLCQPLAPRA